MRSWDTVLQMVSIYMVIVAPMRVAFPTIWPTPVLVVIDGISSLLLLLDLLLRFFTAFEDEEVDPNEVRLPMSLSMSLSMCLPMRLSMSLSMSLSMCLPMSLSMCLHMRI